MTAPRRPPRPLQDDGLQPTPHTAAAPRRWWRLHEAPHDHRCLSRCVRGRPRAHPAADVTRGRILSLIAGAHTLIWLSIESCVIYLLWAGRTGRSGRGTAVAGAVVAAEGLVFAANGFRCPLTDLAEAQGADHASVTDLYLPASFARVLPAVHVPILILIAVLHRKNLRNGRTVRSTAALTPRALSRRVRH